MTKPTKILTEIATMCLRECWIGYLNLRAHFEHLFTVLGDGLVGDVWDLSILGHVTAADLVDRLRCKLFRRATCFFTLPVFFCSGFSFDIRSRLPFICYQEGPLTQAGVVQASSSSPMVITPLSELSSGDVMTVIPSLRRISSSSTLDLRRMVDFVDRQTPHESLYVYCTKSSRVS